MLRLDCDFCRHGPTSRNPPRFTFFAGHDLYFLCGQGEKGEGTTIAYTVQQSHLRFGKDKRNKLAKWCSFPVPILEIFALGNFVSAETILHITNATINPCRIVLGS